MTTQTVVLTPDTDTTITEALRHVGALMPQDVRDHLDECKTAGALSLATSKTGDEITLTSTWSDDASLATYKTLMAGVSSNIKTQLAVDGWTAVFTPETVDL